MTSFIITSKDAEKRKDYVLDFCRKLEISPVDITLIQKETAVKQNVQSIGITEIKNMQQKIFLKPIKSRNKAVIFEEAHLLTTEAQNALLKVLEEPPDNTILILSSDTKEAFLPTIISRCKIVAAGDERQALSEKEKKELLAFMTDLENAGIGECLRKAEVLAKDKDRIPDFLEKLILVLREKMLEDEDPEKAQYYMSASKNFQELHTTLKTTNVNTRFALENAFLKFIN